MLPQFYTLMVGLATALLGMYGLNYNSDVGIFTNPMPWLLGTAPIVPVPTVTAIQTQTKMVTVSVYPEETLVAIPTYQPTMADTAAFASPLESVEYDFAEIYAVYLLARNLVVFLAILVGGYALRSYDDGRLAELLKGRIEIVLESAIKQIKHQGDNTSSSEPLPTLASVITENMPEQLSMPGDFDYSDDDTSKATLFTEPEAIVETRTLDDTAAKVPDTSDDGVTKAPLSMEPEATMETRTEDTIAQVESQAEASNSRPIIVNTTLKRVNRKQNRVSYFAETDTVRPSDTIKRFMPSAVGLASTSEIAELQIDEVPEVPIGQADTSRISDDDVDSPQAEYLIRLGVQRTLQEIISKHKRIGGQRPIERLPSQIPSEPTETINKGATTEQFQTEMQTPGDPLHDSSLDLDHSAAETSISRTVPEIDPAVHQPNCDEPAAPLEHEKGTDTTFEPTAEQPIMQAEEVNMPNIEPTPPEQQATRTEGTPVVQSLYDPSSVPEDLDLNETPQTPQTPIHGCGGSSEQEGGLLTPAPTPTPINFSLPEQQEILTPALSPIPETLPEQQATVVEMPSTPVQEFQPEQQETVKPPALSPMDPIVQIPFAPIRFSLPEQQEILMTPAPTHDTLPEQQETLTPALPPVPQNLPQQQDTVMTAAPDSQLDAGTLQQQLEDQQMEDELRAELEKDDPEDMETDENPTSAEAQDGMSIDEPALPTEAAEDMITDEEAPAETIEGDDGDESMDTDEPMPNAAPLPEHEETNMTPAPAPTHDPLPEQQDAVMTPVPAPDSTHGLTPEQQDVDMTPPPPTPESPLPGQEDTDMTPAPPLPEQQQTPTNTPTTLPSPPEPAQPSAPTVFELEQAALRRDEEFGQDPANDPENDPQLDETGEVQLYDPDLEEEFFGGEFVPMSDDDDRLSEVAKLGEKNEAPKDETTSDQGSENETPTKSRKRKASHNNPPEKSDQRDSKRNETQQAHDRRPNYSVGLLESHHQLFPGTKMPEVKAESTARAASAAAKSTPSSNSTVKSAGSGACLPTPATTPASSPPEQSESPTTPSPANSTPPPTNPSATPAAPTTPKPPHAKAEALTTRDLAELSQIKTRMTGKHLQSLERILVSNSRLWTRDPTGRIEYDITAQTAITQQRLFKFACTIRDEGGLESPAAARRAESTFARAGDAETSHAEYRADVQSGKPKARAEEHENEKPSIGRGGGPSASDISDPHAPSLVDIYGIKKALCGFRGEQKARLAQLVQRQGIDCDVKSNLADVENFPTKVQHLVLGFVLGEVKRDEERARRAKEEEARLAKEEEEREAMDEGESESEDDEDGGDDGDDDVEDSLEEDEFGEAWRREQVFEDLGREFVDGEAAKAKARDEMEMEAEVEWRPKPSRFNRRLMEMREALGRM